MSVTSSSGLSWVLIDARARTLALRLYERAVAQNWPFLSDLCADLYREERVAPSERALITNVLHAMVRLKRKVEFAAEPATLTDLLRLQATLVLLYELGPADASLGNAETARVLERVAGVDSRLAQVQDGVQRIGLQYSLPDWLVQLMVGQLGEVRGASLASVLNEDAPLTLRVNALRMDRESALAALREEGAEVEPTAHSPWGIRVIGTHHVFASPLFQDGSVEVQDEASQLVAEVVAPPPGGTVLDACAGAGGKTLALGVLLKNKGRLVALDVSKPRLEELRKRARRAQLFNVQAIGLSRDAPSAVLGADQAILDKLVGSAERVLVDAPCSGLGALRRNPEARWRLQPEDVTRLASEQEAVVNNALKYVAPRGRLIYATCTFLKDECEDMVDRVLAAHPELERVRVKEVLGGARSAGLTDEQGMCLRTWPDLHGMDGFFAAVLRRKAA